MPILCAHCKGYHPSIEDVRVCASHDNFVRAGSPRPTNWQAAMMTLEPTKAPTEMGMYRQTATGDLFRVYKAQTGSHLLCKRLVKLSSGNWTFIYAGAARTQVKAHERLGLDEAKEFGQQFGVCCCCGKLLTDPESVAAGIGPVCAGKV